MLRSIQQQVEKTYFSLRIAAAVIGFAFPLVLWIGGHIAGFGLRDSMSAYYHATSHSLVKCNTPCSDLASLQKAAIPEAGSMRNAFVGLLFAIGTILYVNKGHTRHENILLSIAGVLTCCIAIFPMPWKCKPSGPITMHYVCAILFFVCIAGISIFCSRDTLKYLPPSLQSRYKSAYLLLACIMLASPALAYLSNESILGRHESYAFWVEFIGIYAFGLYWLVKTSEISIIKKEREAQKSGRHADAISVREPGALEIPADRFF